MVSCCAEWLAEPPLTLLSNLYIRPFLSHPISKYWKVRGIGTDMEIFCGLQMLRVDGGASANNLMLQMQADLLQVPVMRPAYMETTAIGAAFAAGKHPHTSVNVTGTCIFRGSL